MKDSKTIGDFELFFEINYESSGKMNTYELIPNGRNVQVTEKNLHMYIEKRINFLKEKDKMIINEIIIGINSVITNFI